MHGLAVQNLPRVTAEAVLVNRLDAVMRFMALITIEPSHGDLFREKRLSGSTMTGQAAFSIRDEPTGLFR
jgi:hypothetical protein